MAIMTQSEVQAPSGEPLRLVQAADYAGDDWWTWSIWLEASDDVLDAVQHVVYRLHRTFPDPVRLVSDRETRFRLDASGWGVFTVHVRVCLRDGHEVAGQLELMLRYPDGTPCMA